MFEKSFKCVQDWRYRNYLITLISCLLLFLVPVTGWNPLLLLWLFNLLILYRENVHSAIRFFYGTVMVVVSALIVWNLFAGFFLK